MNISSYSREALSAGLQRARNHQEKPGDPVRILFSPTRIDSKNIDDVFRIYSGISRDDFDTVVVVESHPGSAEKKLPMPSFRSVSTPLGEVFANDKLRNDFCDEDDDFFIDDAAFDEDVSLYDQLMMLQCTLDDFSVLSIQITDENSFIVKELAFALEEILASRNALIIFCCNLDTSHSEELTSLMAQYNDDNMTGLMNTLNSGTSSIEGIGSFMTGLIVAKKWGLKVSFISPEIGSGNNLISGFAKMQRQPIFG